MTDEYRVEIKPGRGVSVKASTPAGRPVGGAVLAHGMANDLDFPLLATVADHLARAGLVGVRYNFLYREEGRDHADSADVLAKTSTEVYRDTLSRYGLTADRTFIGGKSLGARVSTQVMADGLNAAGLVYLGFPLHPPGRPDQARGELLASVGNTPQYFIAGDRDHLAPLDMLREIVDGLTGPARLHVIDGGDHSFHLPKDDPRTQEDLDADIARLVTAWLQEQLGD
jgi:hypothetical protein